MTRVCTSHFKSLTHAEAYYHQQGSMNTARDVMAKLAAGEIMLGPPAIPVGTELGCDSDGRYYIDELSRWEKRKPTPSKVRYENARQPKPYPATMAQLVHRSIKAAGGYPAPKGYKVVGYEFTTPKQTASLVVLRTHWTIRVQVSRAGAHHLTGRVYTRLVARGRSFNEALEYAVKRVRQLRARAKIQDAIDEAGMQ